MLLLLALQERQTPDVKTTLVPSYHELPSCLPRCLRAVVQNEFNSVTFYTAGGEAVPGSQVLSGGVAGVSLSQVNNGLGVGENLAVLLGIAVGARSLAFAMLTSMAKLKRL